MPKPKNTGLRILIPLIATGIGAVVFLAMLKSSAPTGTPATAAATTPDSGKPAPATAATDATQASPASTPTSSTATDAKPAPTTAQATPAMAAGELRARLVSDRKPLAPVGDLDPKGKVRLHIDFSEFAAGIKSLQLSQHFTTINEESHVELQSEQKLADSSLLVPFAALSVEVTLPGAQPKLISLAGDSGPVWAQIAPGQFEAIVEDDKGADVLRLTRKFAIAPDSSDVRVEQKIENRSSIALSVRWYQTGPVDLFADAAAYGGDRRFLRMGYLLPASRDPGRTPLANNFDKGRAQIPATAWPTPDTTSSQFEPAWLAFTNRYFGVGVHALFTPLAPTAAEPLAWLDSAERIGSDLTHVIGLRLTSKTLSLAPAATQDLSFGMFAGPLENTEIKAEPMLRALRMNRMVVYNFGGPCGWCTFEWVTGLLLFIMKMLHDHVVHDWALSIVCLVLVVRTCMHPITRFTQTRMARFSKQMQAVQPKQKLLQEKYANDAVKLQQETAKLWREEGISPAGFLGCLPAFAQTPVWIGLSAVLFFAVEFRHEHGFYGVIQGLFTKGSPFWYFMADMSEPDRFLYFGRTIVTVPIVNIAIDSINVLPMILGVVYYLQQTYFTPQTTAPTTPEQETQMKVMRYMTIIMFPALMYKAPAALSLYFVVNTTLAIAESKWIRSHMEKHDMLNVDRMRAERAARSQAKGAAQPAGGFMAALEKYARDKQQQTERRFGQDKPKK